MEEKTKQKIQKFLALFSISVSDTAAENILQFIKFGIVGATNTAISYLLNIAVLFLMRPLNAAWDFVAGNVVSFLLSVLWSFYWNNRFVFTAKEGEERFLLSALLKAYISYGFTGIILNNILSWFWIHVLYISKFTAPLINLIISVPLNFVINKFWTFKSK
nr:GtrA family protein [uncultured Acetatifactor sp.]